MELFRLYAFSVWPLRTTDRGREPEGGNVKITAELRDLLEENRSAADFGAQPRIDFDVDEGTRTSDVRDDIVSYGFGEPATAKAAALDLAQRLGASMDRRSSPALLVPAAYKDGDRRRVILWVFPSEAALRFRHTSDGAEIEILREVFSQRSQLRKAALFEGRHVRTDFLSGKALDFQATRGTREVADFWISRFLGCRLSIDGASGSRMLARMIKAAHDRLEDPDDREQLHASAIAIRRSPQRRISATGFAARYLEAGAREAFLSVGGSPEAMSSLFDFDRDAFDGVLHFRVFTLEAGVVVSAPPDQVGRTVRLQGTAERTLICEGVIVGERLRSTHA